MKKIVCILIASLLSVSAFAAMDDVTSSGTTVTTAGFTNSYIVRGEIEGVIVTIPSAKTATVSIVTASGVTLYTGTALTSATDGYVPLRYPAQGSTGSTLTWLTSQAAAANAATNIIYDTIGIAELVTFAVNPAANTTETNTYSVKLVVNK
jgi:hypothetical protein